MITTWSYLIDESNDRAREALDFDLRVVLQHRALRRLSVARPKSPTITYQGDNLPINRDVMDSILAPDVSNQTLTCDFGENQSVCVLLFNNTQVVAEHGSPTMVRKLRKTASRSELPFSYTDFYKWSYPHIAMSDISIIVRQLEEIMDIVKYTYILEHSTMTFVSVTQSTLPHALLRQVTGNNKLVFALGTPIRHLIHIKKTLVGYSIAEYQHHKSSNYITHGIFNHFNSRHALMPVIPTFWKRYTMCGDILGEGSYGAVYSVVDDSGVAHAAKIGEVAKLHQDGEILRELKHPGVVKYYGTFLIPPTPSAKLGPDLKAVILMEQVHGVDLEVWINQKYEARTSVSAHGDAIMSIFTSAIKAVRYLHRHGIVHHDIKPENIMVTPTNKAVLIDFGFAHKYLDMPLLSTRASIKGSTLFMPPEFFNWYNNTTHTNSLYPKADVFSLAATFYVVLTGNCPPWIVAKTKAVQFSLPKLHRARVALLTMPGALPFLIYTMLDPNPLIRPTVDKVCQELLHPSHSPHVGEKA